MKMKRKDVKSFKENHEVTPDNINRKILNLKQEYDRNSKLYMQATDKNRKKHFIKKLAIEVKLNYLFKIRKQYNRFTFIKSIYKWLYTRL